MRRNERERDGESGSDSDREREREREREKTHSSVSVFDTIVTLLYPLFVDECEKKKIRLVDQVVCHCNQTRCFTFLFE